ncbi:MAG: hypothetical protein LKJ24_07105 [Lacticaseibacillus paracasei]|nr:hypothetical protein [Lacticaseibacillus paracasei]
MIKAKLFKIYQVIIQIFIYPTFFLTLYAAIRSDQLNPATVSHPLFVLILCMIVVLSIFWIHRRTVWQVVHVSYTKVREHAGIFICLSMILAALIQVIILLNTNTPLGWDVGSVVTVAIDPSIGSNYVSINPNNLFLISFYHSLYALFVSPATSTANAWLFFQFVTVIGLDLSVFFLIYAVKSMFNLDVALMTYFIFYALFVFTPYIQAPYSDVAVLFPVSLTLVCLTLLDKKQHLWTKFALAFATAVLTAIVFATKPSAIIIVIAWIIDKLVCEFLVNDSTGRSQRILIVLCVALGFVGANRILSDVTTTYTPIKIEKNQALPWQHFAYMGLTGNGGYNDKIKGDTLKLKETAKMRIYSLNGISRRLHELGIVGYLQFLTAKQMNNTARGDFTWGVDGIPLQPFRKAKGSFQNRIRSLYLVGGSHTSDLSFCFQVIWILSLIGIMLSLFLFSRDGNEWSRILFLTIVGGFLYLLLFEGGRSRYLIQYLPALVPLAAWGWSTGIQAVEKYSHKGQQIGLQIEKTNN